MSVRPANTEHADDNGSIRSAQTDGEVTQAPALPTAWKLLGAGSQPQDSAMAETLAGKTDPSQSRDRVVSALPRVPGYVVLDELGRGGMGVVYLARQEGLARLIALKMIRSGELSSDTDQERLRREAETIARLRHPNIVQIFEVGEHLGLPFFSLEYCEGGSLRSKHKGTALGANEAAQLVETVARAVQAAHDAGIVHRDLKPDNVLLLADGTPKVTDFGLAKTVDSQGPTRTGAVVGTPSYMAPEQTLGDGREVNRSVDIYALGAMFYDLMTGRPPFLGTSALDTLRQVQENEPLAPRRLEPSIPRDLETICLKCLQKDPAKRYASALELAEDLRRFREHRPIAARPVSRFEHAWRWCRRNPVVAALSAGIVLVFLASFSVVAWQWQRAIDREKAERAARQDAEVARREQEKTSEENARLADDERRATLKAKEEEKKALAEAARSRKSLQFLTSLFRVSDPMDFGGYALRSSHERGRALTAQQLLERGSTQLNADLKDQPLVRATLLGTIGDVYRSMGLFDIAAPHLNESLALLRAEHGDHHPDVAAAMFNVGWLHMDRGEFDRAEALFRQALKIQEATLPRDDPATVTSRLHVAWVLILYGEPEAEPLAREVIAARTKLFGPIHRETVIAKLGLASYYFDNGRAPEALPLLNDLVKYIEAEGGKDNFEAIKLFQQGLLAAGLGGHPQAQKLFEESLELARRQLGDKHSYNALVLHELARSLNRQGKIGESEKRLRECLQVLRESVGLEYPRAYIAIVSMTELLVNAKRPKEAIALLDEALAANARRFGPQNRWRFALACERANLEARHGAPERTESLANECLTLLPLTPGKDVRKATALNNLGVELNRIDKNALAETCYREAIAIRRSLEKSDASNFAILLSNYGDLLMEERRFVEAEAPYREALRLAREAKGYTAGDMVDRHYELAGALAEQGRLEDATTLLRVCCPITHQGVTTFYENGLRYLATIQKLQGQQKEAGVTVQTLLKHFANDKRIALRLRVMRTLLLFDLPGEGTTEAKASQATEYLMKNPGDRDATVTLALAQLRQGKPDAADKALAALPKEVAEHFPIVAFLRSWAAHDRGETGDARQLFEKGCRLLDNKTVPDKIAAGAIAEWHHRLEARLVRESLEKRLQR